MGGYLKAVDGAYSTSVVVAAVPSHQHCSKSVRRHCCPSRPSLVAEAEAQVSSVQRLHILSHQRMELVELATPDLTLPHSSLRIVAVIRIAALCDLGVLQAVSMRRMGYCRYRILAPRHLPDLIY